MKVIAILFAFSAAGLAQIGVFGNSSDIGETPKAGSSAFDAAKGEYRITGGGANVWAAKDAFQFVWKRASGDITLTADIHFVGAGAVPHRKAMLMIRQSLDPGAPYADIALHGSGLTSLQYRLKAGEATVGVPSKIEAPVRIRIERRGDRITAYAGNPGQELAPIGPATVGLQDPVYVGLGLCSHDANILETALFTNVTLEAAPASAVKSFVTVYDLASGDRKVVFTDARRQVSASQHAGQTMAPAACDRRDGTLLAISAGNIYTLPAAGTEPKQITNQKLSYFHGFSPDGKWMVFRAQRDNNFDIYRIPTEGGPEERLTSPSRL